MRDVPFEEEPDGQTTRSNGGMFFLPMVSAILTNTMSLGHDCHDASRFYTCRNGSLGSQTKNPLGMTPNGVSMLMIRYPSDQPQELRLARNVGLLPYSPCPSE
jgi:hypothetical protein